METKKKPSKEGTCKCPPTIQKICRKRAITSGKDVEDIIKALEFEAAMGRRMHNIPQPMFKTKPFKPPHFRDTCVPMVPSMHTRLRYIGHCPAEPMKTDPLARKAYDTLELPPSSSDDDLSSGILSRGKKKKKPERSKKVRYSDLCFCAIEMPTPMAVVMHTESDKSIFSVGSPNLSGENIAAQRASVKPVDQKPPLPPKAIIELNKAHSGIIVNKDKDYVPEMAPFVGPKWFKSGKRKRLSCSKRGVCGNKTCNKKKCGKHHSREGRLGGKSKSGSYLNSGPCILRPSKHGRNRPMSRSSQRYVAEEDVCGLDDIPKPDHAFVPANLKKGSFRTHSLTVLPCKKEKRTEMHYGILTGTFNMYDSKYGPKSRGRQALTMSVMAYCLAFHYHPKQWTMKLVDNLVDAGDQWYLQCADKVHDHSAYMGICEVLPFGKKQILTLNGKRMQVLLCEPEIVGYTMSLDPTIYNLSRGLIAFFKENRAGILLTRILKLVIWKDKICYYIFDPAGRNSRAYSNYDKGSAALINVKDLEAVAEILLARSVLDDQKFVLAPVKVLKMVDASCDEDLESEREYTQAEKAMMGYRILTANCAIVNANMHLGDRCFEDAKFRQALPIAIVAMTYAKISPPNTWFTKTLDKILRLGNKLYLDCVQPKVIIDVSIDNIPNEILMGPYCCEIIIYRERVKGQLFTPKECLLNIKRGLDEFFSHEYNCGILEFNNYTLAIWRQKDMYYLFDPYPRTLDGSRSLKTGKACCLMLLDTQSMADAIANNWDYLPATTQYQIHAFKVLRLKKKSPKTQIMCVLSDNQLPGNKGKRSILPAGDGASVGQVSFHQDVLPVEVLDVNRSAVASAPLARDEEQMGDIISLVDSIQDDYVPKIPMRYKNLPPEEYVERVVNLDSPTVSVTQVVPPWPKPRDKTNEPPEPDPEYEPTPPPTPPPPPPPEGGAEEEEEMGDEEMDEETAKKKKEDEARKKAEEEEARRKAEELPPPMAPPPPSPQPEPEVPLAVPPDPPMEQEMETLEPVNVERHVLLTEDARYRYKLRQIRQKMTAPLTEPGDGYSQTQELEKPSNFKDLPDCSQIIRGTEAIPESHAQDLLPFAAIMALITSYKYSINTWTSGVVNFVVSTAKKLYEKKREKFNLAPVHIIPKLRIGQQAYRANIDVVGEGPTWKMEEVISDFLESYDRGMITTCDYSCAFVMRNGLFYLYDGSQCDGMGIREGIKGKACLLRFRNLHDLVCRILYNKDGKTEDQQFILSRVIVRRLLPESRYKLPEDYDYATGQGKTKKSKPTYIPTERKKSAKDEITEPKTSPQSGYQLIDGIYRIEGTTSLSGKKATNEVKSCHFVCLIAMLMAAMHPIRTWNQVMVDTCIEKGMEIFEKAKNLNVCEKRVIRNIILDGKFININIKKIIVVNENPEKYLEQYLKAVMRRLRYVLIRFPECSLVVCNTEGFYHLFDPYPATGEEAVVKEEKKRGSSTSFLGGKKASPVATWTLYASLEALVNRVNKEVGKSANNPEFYTFELTSVKSAPRRSALNYRLSPLFKADENPNVPYLKRRKIRPIVDEKMYWLDIPLVPWTRMSPVNDLGFDRNTPKTLWKAWDIEFPGDLYSLWGRVHPTNEEFPESNRGKQYLCTCVVALGMVEACHLSAWTGSFLDGIVKAGDKYYAKCAAKLGNKRNHELSPEDLDPSFDEMYPFAFTAKFENVIFGFVYNMYPDRFNLSKAVAYFFEKHTRGILVSPGKNLAFGRAGTSYFMYDCQSYGAPIFSPGQGASYMLKCESINRLIYCMAVTLNLRRHGQQFHLYSGNVNVTDKSK